MGEPNMMYMVPINDYQQAICYQILNKTPELRSGIDKIQAAIGEPDIINQDNQKIDRTFKRDFCDDILAPLNEQFMDYILAFGFCCIQWVKSRKSVEPVPEIMNYGTYEVKMQTLPGCQRQYFCFRKGSNGIGSPMAYNPFTPDQTIHVEVRNHPTEDGQLTSRIYTVYRTIAFGQSMDMSAATAEQRRADPLLLTETRDSVQGTESVLDLPYYTPSDYSEIDALRKANVQVNAVRSAQFASNLAYEQNAPTTNAVFRDPISGIPTYENYVQPSYMPKMFQLPPDQKLVNQQLPPIRPDLIDLKDHVVSMVCAILQLPVAICFPSRTRGTVADTDQDTNEMEKTVSRWKTRLTNLDERIYSTIYRDYDEQYYRGLITQYEIERLRRVAESDMNYGMSAAEDEIARTTDFVTSILSKSSEANAGQVVGSGSEKGTDAGVGAVNLATPNARFVASERAARSANAELSRRQKARPKRGRRVPTDPEISSTIDTELFLVRGPDDMDIEVEESSVEDSDDGKGEVMSEDTNDETDAVDEDDKANQLAPSHSDRIEDYKQVEKQEQKKTAVLVGHSMRQLSSTFESHDDLEDASYWNLRMHKKPLEDIIVPNKSKAKTAASTNKKSSRGAPRRSGAAKQEELKLPSYPTIRVVFPGIISQTQLNSMYQRGLLAPLTYKNYVAAAMGLPPETLILPPEPDIIRQIQQETEQLELLKEMQEHQITLQNDQNDEMKRSNREQEKANKEAAKNGLAAGAGGVGAGKKPASGGGGPKASSSAKPAASKPKPAAKSNSSSKDTSRRAGRSSTSSKSSKTNQSGRDKTSEAAAKQKNKDKDKTKASGKR